MVGYSKRWNNQGTPWDQPTGRAWANSTLVGNWWRNPWIANTNARIRVCSRPPTYLPQVRKLSLSLFWHDPPPSKIKMVVPPNTISQIHAEMIQAHSQSRPPPAVPSTNWGKYHQPQINTTQRGNTTSIVRTISTTSCPPSLQLHGRLHYPLIPTPSLPNQPLTVPAGSYFINSFLLLPNLGVTACPFQLCGTGGCLSASPCLRHDPFLPLIGLSHSFSSLLTSSSQFCWKAIWCLLQQNACLSNARWLVSPALKPLETRLSKYTSKVHILILIPLCR